MFSIRIGVNTDGYYFSIRILPYPYKLIQIARYAFAATEGALFGASLVQFWVG